MDTSAVNEKTALLFGFLRGFNLVLINEKRKPGDPETEKFIESAINSIIDGVLKFP
jgi:hypothetical protein